MKWLTDFIDVLFEKIFSLACLLIFFIKMWQGADLKDLIYYGILTVVFMLNEIYWVLKRKK